MSDEVVDIKIVAEEAAKKKCNAQFEEYKKCELRITGEDGEFIKGKHCTGFALEYWKCIDTHAAPVYFKKFV